MKVRVNRKREGKKTVEAPREIEIYNDQEEKIAIIRFSCILNKILIHIIDGSQFRAVMFESHDGYPVKLNEHHMTKWAEVGEITLRN